MAEVMLRKGQTTWPRYRVYRFHGVYYGFFQQNTCSTFSSLKEAIAMEHLHEAFACSGVQKRFELA